MTKRTKIICTLGPSVDTDEMIERLIGAGMDVARFNFSHGSHEEHRARMDRLRRVREKLDSPCAIMLDTRGPEIRTGLLAGGAPVRLSAGTTITLTEQAVAGNAERISQSCAGLAAAVEPGTSILVDDGLIELTVSDIRGTDIVCVVQNSGDLGQRKSINVPHVDVPLPIMTDQDKSDLLFGIEQGVDFVAASFVRSAQDVHAIKDFLAEHGGQDISLIAKIESSQAVPRIDEIIQAADGIMIARGDLGVEIDASLVPHLQKEIIRACNLASKPVITATQMLDSMIRNPRPTRAEVADVANAIYDGTDAVMLSGCNLASKPVITATQMLDSMIRNPRPTRAEVADVANAIYDGTDAVMLSGETASGAWPVDAVTTMAQIAETSDQHVFEQGNPVRTRSHPSVALAVGLAAVQTAEVIGASCIVAPTISGYTARLVSHLRPRVPIFAVTPYEKTMRRLQLNWGVTPMMGEVKGDISGYTARLVSHLRPRVPIFAVTPYEKTMRRLQLNWGVTPMMGEVKGDMRRVTNIAHDAVLERKFAKPGDIAIITAGDSLTSPALTPKAATIDAGADPAPIVAATNVMYAVQIHDRSLGNSDTNA